MITKFFGLKWNLGSLEYVLSIGMIVHTALYSVFFTDMNLGKSTAWSLINWNWYLLASIYCFFQSKEEVMAVRLREADRIAAVAELQQHIAELEIQVTADGLKCETWCWFTFCTYWVSFLPLYFLINLFGMQYSALPVGIMLSSWVGLLYNQRPEICLRGRLVSFINFFCAGTVLQAMHCETDLCICVCPMIGNFYWEIDEIKNILCLPQK